MSENLSGGSGGSENLVSPPQRTQRAAPPPAQPRRQPDAAPQHPMTEDDMKLKKKIQVGKPLTLKGDKKKD